MLASNLCGRRCTLEGKTGEIVGVSYGQFRMDESPDWQFLILWPDGTLTNYPCPLYLIVSDR